LPFEHTPVFLLVGIYGQAPARVQNLENGGNQEAHVRRHPHFGKTKIESQDNKDEGGETVHQIR
jgi:hypothetical protein